MRNLIVLMLCLVGFTCFGCATKTRVNVATGYAQVDGKVHMPTPLAFTSEDGRSCAGLGVVTVCVEAGERETLGPLLGVDHQTGAVNDVDLD